MKAPKYKKQRNKVKKYSKYSYLQKPAIYYGIINNGITTMNINKNLLFRKLTEEICTSIEIEETLIKSFRYFKNFIPADGLTFDITNNDGSITSIARICGKEADISDIKINLSSKGQKEEKENKDVTDVMIYNAPDLNPISLDFAKHLKTPEASNLVLYLDLGDGMMSKVVLLFIVMVEMYILKNMPSFFRILKFPFQLPCQMPLNSGK